MNVFLDAQPLLGPRSGIARYVECLAKQFAQQPNLNVSLAFNRIAKSIRENHVISMEHDFHLHLINNMYPYKVIRRLLTPNLLYHFPYDLMSNHKADLFHGTNFTYTPIFKGKHVITIHDLAYMHYPEATSERILKHHSKWVPYSAQKCDYIIADSIQTKKDIEKLLRIPENKIGVVPLAADEHFRYIDNYADILKKYDLPSKYVLFVGTLEPRKNLIGLLESFSLLKKQYDVEEKLVIVGARGWKFTPIFNWVKEHKLENEVIFTGFIDDDDLPAIYSAATLFVMPSIYEGFGLPLLEAMQCGTPVIGSNVSSIPEIIENAGILIAPDDYSSWAEAIYTIISNASLRETYTELALERAKQFTWRQTAEQTIKIYTHVLGSM